MKITVRMCVELDYEVEVDPTDYKDGDEFYREIESDIENNVEGYVKNISIIQPSIEETEVLSELEDVQDYIDNIDRRQRNGLDGKKIKLVDKIIEHIEDLEEAVDESVKNFVYNNGSSRLIKEMTGYKNEFEAFVDALDKINWKEDEATEEEWDELEKCFNEWLKKYEELK